MHTDTRALGVVCAHFQNYENDEIKEMRRRLQLQHSLLRRLQAELFFLRIVLKACLQYNRAISNAGG